MLLEAVGWIGSVLVVLSLTLANVLRFRILNLLGSVVATAYNAVLEIWPFVAMNLAIAVINVYWLIRLRRDTRRSRDYAVIEVPMDGHLVRHLVSRHAAEIAAHYPAFDPAAPPAVRTALLTLHEDEAIGLLVLRHGPDGVGVVELDFVTRRFQDLSPGRHMYLGSGALRHRGLREVRLAGAPGAAQRYFEEIGFVERDGTWTLPLDAGIPA